MTQIDDTPPTTSRLTAGAVGALLALGAYLGSGIAFEAIAGPDDEGVVSHSCSGQYHCPSDAESTLVGLAIGLVAFAIVALMAYAAVNLLRHALGGRPATRRTWIAALLGPAMIVPLAFAVVAYGAWIGAFS